MTTRSITDQQVAALPIHGGRAELLEEIMRTPVDQVDHAERNPDHLSPRRGRRALAIAAAVAAVAVTVGGLAAWRIPQQTATPDGTSFGDDAKVSTGTHARHDTRPSSQKVQVRSVPGGAYVALTASGWSVTNLSEDGLGYQELRYARDGEALDIEQYPGDKYPMYFANRQQDGPGTPLTLLGQDATQWAYAPDDHAAMRTPQGDSFVEVRGTGMTESVFADLLADLVQTDAAGLASSLPDGIVTPYNHGDAIRHLLLGVETPAGFTPADVSMTGFNDAYQSAAQVAGAVGCAWIDVWGHGTEADRQAAIAAFDGSRSWPLLQKIAHQGGYSSLFWSYADRLRAGHTDKGQPLTVDGLKAGICW